MAPVAMKDLVRDLEAEPEARAEAAASVVSVPVPLPLSRLPQLNSSWVAGASQEDEARGTTVRVMMIEHTGEEGAEDLNP